MVQHMSGGNYLRNINHHPPFIVSRSCVYNSHHMKFWHVGIMDVGHDFMTNLMSRKMSEHRYNRNNKLMIQR